MALALAGRLLQAGSPDDLKASVAASREACELLRKMRQAAVHPKAQQRGLAEREAVILDKMTELAQAPARTPPGRREGSGRHERD